MGGRFLYKNTIFKIALHLAFWAVSYYVLLYNYASSSEFSKIDYIYTAIFLIAPVFAVYINFYILIPYFFQKRKYLVYIIFLTVLVVVSVGIHSFSFNVLTDLIFKDYYIISYVDTWQISRTLIIFLGITTLAHLSQSWFQLYESKARLQEVEKEKALYQLESLRAQINPHFLFNSLNSIYSLALRKSTETPGIILKLSDVLRYVIYDSNQDRVDMEKELDFIANYIDLQKLRTHISDKINYSVKGSAAGIKIAPLIFIVFIENAFKHGFQGDVENQFINIIINITGEYVEFISENNAGKANKVEPVDAKGIGLENVKKRLEIMYPGKYTLAIRNDPEKYSIRLKLDL